MNRVLVRTIQSEDSKFLKHFKTLRRNVNQQKYSCEHFFRPASLTTICGCMHRSYSTLCLLQLTIELPPDQSYLHRSVWDNDT